jgi:hypothetical protein
LVEVGTETGITAGRVVGKPAGPVDAIEESPLDAVDESKELDEIDEVVESVDVGEPARDVDPVGVDDGVGGAGVPADPARVGGWSDARRVISRFAGDEVDTDSVRIAGLIDSKEANALASRASRMVGLVRAPTDSSCRPIGADLPTDRV